MSDGETERRLQQAECDATCGISLSIGLLVVIVLLGGYIYWQQRTYAGLEKANAELKIKFDAQWTALQTIYNNLRTTLFIDQPSCAAPLKSTNPSTCSSMGFG